MHLIFLAYSGQIPDANNVVFIFYLVYIPEADGRCFAD